MSMLSPLSKTCVALAVGQLIALPSISTAATITVNSPTDDGVGCTLREALVSANTSANQNNDCAMGSNSGTDTITFSNSLVSNTITLANGRLLLPPINKDIEVNASAISGGITIDAAKNSRILSSDYASLTLDNLTLINGLTEGGNLGGESNGGAILAYSSNLTLRNTTISGNTAAFNGGGIAAISSTINLYDSTVDGNATTGGEGSPRSEGSSGGGIYANGDGSTNANSLRLVNSTISNNASYGAGGIHASAGVNVTIDNSLISGNTSSKTEYRSGGGISANNVVMAINNSSLTDNITLREGGSFLADSSTVTLNNSILSGNKASGGGGFLSQSSTVTLVNSTLSDNSAGRGGGFYSRASITTLNNSTLSDNYSSSDGGAFASYSGSMTLNNTTLSNNSSSLRTVINSSNAIVTLNHTTLSGNTAGAGQPIMNIREGFSQTGRASLINSIIANSPGVLCSGAVTTDSATIIEDGSCGASRYGDPDLLALANNGGPTQTHALSATSIARNSSVGSCLETDQRGVTRNISDGFCDVGAFEFKPSLAISTSLASIIEGNDGTTVFSFTVSRSVNTLGASSVDYTVTESSSSPADPADFGGSFPSGSISFADGESSKMETISISGDTDIEPDEMFMVSLSNPINAEISAGAIVATIVNDDVDTDEDGTADSIDPDDDNDTVPDSQDNCQFIDNPDQQDTDSDLFGDACDDDDDGDNIPDVDDVCPLIQDPDQADQDNDGVGDACEVEDEICFTIKTASGNVATICL